MARQNKYQYLRILQGLFEGEWADIIACDKHASSQEKRRLLKTLEAIE